MSQYIDFFVKEHKEYFLRNKKVIESNTWNDTTNQKEDVEDITRQLLNLKDSSEKDVNKDILKLQESFYKTLEYHKKRRNELFKQENDLTTSILGRLTSFIQEIEKSGERQDKKAQDFINFTVDIIKIHLKKANDYLNYNLEVLTEETDSEEEQQIKDFEIVFQDNVFQKKIKIQEELSKLNTSGELGLNKIEFHAKKQASLVLREPLIILRDDVKDVVDRIPVDWYLHSSKEMYINMKPSDIPRWNKNKHFFEQESSTIQFWVEEYNKIKNGLTINGYFIHPWLYFHLNFFKTSIPQKDGSEPNIAPPLRDNEWFFAENLKSCINEKYPDFYSKAMLVYGTRRFGKSVIMASLAHWRTVTKFNSFGTIIGGSSSDLNAMTSKIKTSMLYADSAFKLDFIKQEWENGETTFGIKEDASTPIIFSSLIVQNLESGTTKKTQKTAGLAPSVSIYDEIGKYDFLKPYLAALPSFKTPYGFKCITCLAGTGGEASLSGDAMKVLSSPEAYDLLPMNWDLLSHKIDPEFITWKPKNFATFFPGQMAYETGFEKIDTPFSEFIDNDNKELAKISIGITDWKKNTEFLDSEIKKAQSSPDSNLLVQQRRVQYPTDPKHCFLSAEKNPFDYEAAVRHKEYLELSGEWDRRRTLYKDGGEIKSQVSTTPLVDFPFGGGNIDAPFLLFEDLPTEKPPMFMYVAGLDDYKQAASNTDSVGTIYVYKYDMFGDPFAKKLVASYSGRPTKHKDFHKNCLLLLEAYNAVCFMENEDTGFIEFLEELHLEDKFLMKAVDFTSSLNITNNAPRKYGWSPKQSKSKLLNMFINYCNSDIPSIDEGGNEIMVKGLTRIGDIKLLEEIINFKLDGNYDRLSASLGAVGWLHYLEANYMHPNINKKQEGEEKKHRVFQKNLLGSSRGRRTLG